MTIDRDFQVITFWETMKNEKYELKGRINHDERENLKTFLYNSDNQNVETNYFSKKFKDIANFGIENFKNLSPSKKNKLNGSSNPKESKKKDAINNEDGKENIEEDEEEEEKERIDTDEPDTKLDFKDDIVELIEEPILDMENMPNYFKIQSKRKTAKFSTNKDTVKKDNKDSDMNKEPNFLETRKKEITADESKHKELIKLQPKTFFLDKNKQKIKPVELPYKSIEVIWN